MLCNYWAWAPQLEIYALRWKFPRAKTKTQPAKWLKKKKKNKTIEESPRREKHEPWKINCYA